MTKHFVNDYMTHFVKPNVDLYFNFIYGIQPLHNCFSYYDNSIWVACGLVWLKSEERLDISF